MPFLPVVEAILLVVTQKRHSEIYSMPSGTSSARPTILHQVIVIIMAPKGASFIAKYISNNPYVSIKPIFTVIKTSNTIGPLLQLDPAS